MECEEQFVRDMLLEKFPLTKLYDLFLESTQSKKENAARKPVPVVLVSDTGSSDL